MGDIMATKIEHPVTVVPSFEKVLSQNTQFAEKFLGAFKKMISHISVLPDIEKADVTEATKEYLQNSLLGLNIDLPNIEALSEFLVRHIDIIQPLIEVCKFAKTELGDIPMKLIAKTELEDNSNFQSLTLYIKDLTPDEENNDNLLDKIAFIKQPYLHYFRNNEVLFTCQPDYSL